jgi:hypothetical protein
MRQPMGSLGVKAFIINNLNRKDLPLLPFLSFAIA